MKTDALPKSWNLPTTPTYIAREVEQRDEVNQVMLAHRQTARATKACDSAP